MKNNTETNKSQVTDFPVKKSSPENPLEALKTPVGAELVKKRAGWEDEHGNTHYFEYLDWETIADILDERAPGWSFEIRSLAEIGETAIVIARIGIGGVTREAVGTGDAASEIGIKRAEHDALKRAAAKFGVGREVYRRENDVAETRGARTPVFAPKTGPADPRAKSVADLITPRQIGMLKSLCRENGTNLDEECGNFYRNLKHDEISKRAASALIEHLMDAANGAQPPAEAPGDAPPAPPVQAIDEPPVLSAEETLKIEQWRETMRIKLGSCGVPPAPYLAGYDTFCRTFEQKKEKYLDAMRRVLEARRDQIKIALAGTEWEAMEIEGELIIYGIEDGIDRASFDQIEKMWNEYHAKRRFVTAKK